MVAGRGRVRGAAVVLVAGFMALLLGAQPALAAGDASFSSITPANVAWMGKDFADATNVATAARAAGTLGVQDDLAITAAREAGIVGKAPALAGAVTKVGKWIWAVATLKDVLGAVYTFSRGDVDRFPAGVMDPGTGPVLGSPSTGYCTGADAIDSSYGSYTACHYANPAGVWPVHATGKAITLGACSAVTGGAWSGGNDWAQAGWGATSKTWAACVGDYSNWVATRKQVGTVTAPGIGGGAPAVNPYRAPSGAPNPARHIEVTATCVNPVTEASSSVVGSSESYHMDTAGLDAGGTGTAPAVPGVSCPPGTYVDGSKTEVVTDGNSTRIAVDVPYVASPETRAQVRANPECAPVGSTVCELKLWRVVPAPDLDCHASPAGVNNACIDWWDDAAKATKYQCRWAGAVVPLWRCDGYRSVFQVGGPVGVTPPADPGPNPEVVDPSADKTPGLNDDGCMPSGWQLLNPFALLKGFACGLSWAFIPKPGSLSVPFADFSTLWNSRPPGSLVSGAKDVFTAIPAGWGGTSCVGSSSSDFTPSGSAAGALRLPCSPAGGGSGSLPYTVMQIALIVFTLFGLWHMVAGAVGAQATGGGD